MRLKESFIAASHNRVLHHFCDVAPLTLSLSSISEHSASRILGLCALPLVGQAPAKNIIHVHGEAYEPLGAYFISGSPDYKEYVFFLDNRYTWPDGSTISAWDYERGFRQVINNPQNRFKKLLADVASLHVYDGRLVFKLKNAHRLFPLLFSFPALSPAHAQHASYYPGAYTIAATQYEKNELVSLALKAQWPVSNNDVRDIVFTFKPTHEHDEFGIEGFKQGHFDCTWDTYFPYELKNSSLKINIEQSDPNIFVILSTLDCINHDYDILTTLNAIIDKSTLVKACFDAPSSCEGFSLEPMIAARSRIKPMPTRENFIIGYEDFYPNGIIVNNIITQLAARDYKFSSVIYRYGDRSQKSHIRLELLHNPFRDPLLLYRNELSKRNFFERHPELWRQFLLVYSRYQRANAEQRVELSRILDDILQQRGDFLPLLKLPGFRLKHARVGDASYRSGKLWRWSN